MSTDDTRWVESWGRDRRIQKGQPDQVGKCVHDRKMSDYCLSCADQHFEKVVREALGHPPEKPPVWKHTRECSTHNWLRLGDGRMPECICGGIRP
jgi:hypothetical protein